MLRRRHLMTAAATVTLATLTPGYAADAAERILVIGDSQAQGLAAGLQRQYRHDHACHVIDRSRIATGLCSPTRFNWPAEAPGIAQAEPGAVGVVMFGANDRLPLHQAGHIDDKVAAAFTASYGPKVRGIADAMKARCAAVIWVGHPIVRDAAWAEDMAVLNTIYAAQAVAGGAIWFPTWSLFTDDAGDYAPYGKGTDGVTTRLRADDGVHFTTAGYDVLAHALLPVIASCFKGEHPPTT
jgi:hypothetical protein